MSRPALAQSCTATGPTLSLGTVNPYGTSSVTTSGNGTLSCTNPSSTGYTGYACVSIGTGSGGTTTTNRTLASGSNKLPIQINSGGASPQIGNGTSYPMYGPFTFPLPANGSASSNFPIAVTVPPPSPAPPPGSYASTFSSTDAQAIFYTGNASTTCASLNAGTHLTSQFSLPISATVPTQCTVTATGIAFPTNSVLSSTVTAAATITVNCNASTSVTVGLDNGGTGTGPTVRQMKSGSNAITYGIYQDSGYSLPWGNTNGTNTVSLGSGTGTLTAYGRVPAQTSPAPGSYSDVVNVVITY